MKGKVMAFLSAGITPIHVTSESLRKKHIIMFNCQQQPWFSVYNIITSRETLFGGNHHVF
jgi:hypothetical protein